MIVLLPTCRVPLLGGEDLLEGEDLLLGLLQLRLPLLPLPLLLLSAQLLEVPADHRVRGGVDVLAMLHNISIEPLMILLHNEKNTEEIRMIINNAFHDLVSYGT